MDKKTKFYLKRTLEHIHRVQTNMFALLRSDKARGELRINEVLVQQLAHDVMDHDTTKFQNRQYQAYIDFSWAMHVRENKTDRADLTKAQKAAFDAAWLDHQDEESHHCGGRYFMADNASAIEVACDLQAMSQEFGEASARGYFENAWMASNYKHFADDKPGRTRSDWPEFCATISKCITLFDSGVLDEE